MLLNNHLKTLDKNAVRVAAIQLMERNYTTTTLEVKQLLRSQNYWAIQGTISRWMDELAQEEDWHFEHINHHRNYFKNEVTANYFTNMTQEEMDFFLDNIKFSVN